MTDFNDFSSLSLECPSAVTSIQNESVSSSSHIGKIAIFETLKNKICEVTDMIDFSEFPSLFLEYLSGVPSIQYACYYEENKSSSNVNELIYGIFTK